MFRREKDEPRFEIVHTESKMTGLSYRVLLDTITGVQYLFVHDGYAGGLTPLLGADGQPLIRSALEEEWEDDG